MTDAVAFSLSSSDVAALVPNGNIAITNCQTIGTTSLCQVQATVPYVTGAGLTALYGVLTTQTAITPAVNGVTVLLAGMD